LKKDFHVHYTMPCYTSKRLPIKLVFHQEFSSRMEALEAELGTSK